jgi:hypothetical protein
MALGPSASGLCRRIIAEAAQTRKKVDIEEAAAQMECALRVEGWL